MGFKGENMARPYKLKRVSRHLTELLDIDELTAVGGNSYDIEAMKTDTRLPVCDECGGPVENHGKFERTLIDIISVDGNKQFAKLHYIFYKYRCLKKDCGAITQKPMQFVKESSKTTKRYENEIIRHLMYESMDKTRKEMEDYVVDGNNSDLISKPAMAKLLKRWVKDKDELRRFVTPAVVLIYTYNTRFRNYTVIYELANGTLFVLEVLPSISELEIRQFFSKVETEYIGAVIIDCNPVVNQTVKGLFTPGKIMTDTDSVKKILEKEYEECVFERAKKYSKQIRKNLCGTGVGLEVEDSAKVYKIRQEDEILGDAYKKYAKLFTILKDHREIYEAKEWLESVSGNEDLENVFPLTLLYLKSYWSEIVNYYKRRSNVSGSVYEKLYALNEKIESYFSQCTDDIFRARMLYSDFEEIEGSWRGFKCKSNC